MAKRKRGAKQRVKPKARSNAKAKKAPSSANISASIQFKDHPKEREEQKMGRGQVWSIDVLLAVVIFIAIIVVFYFTLNAKSNPGLKELETSAENVKAHLETNPNVKIIDAGEINESRLEELIARSGDNYSALKKELGITGDFCIFYEDEDGNLVLLKDNQTGIGSADLKISGNPCGEKI